MAKKIRYPADFPMDLYLMASDRTRKFVDKWVRVMHGLEGCRGSNNFLLYIDFWNSEHPGEKISIKSLYRNRHKLNLYGWKAFFTPRERVEKLKKVEPPFTDDERRRLRKLLAKMETEEQATA